jgi:hypothetical protein
MSKYLTFTEIVFPDRALLCQALAACGFTQVEEGASLTLYGYRGDARPETGQLVVRRQHLGRYANDLGFTHTPAGYVPIISEYDQSQLQGGQFLTRLRTAYHEAAAQRLALQLKGSVARQQVGQTIKLTIRY